MTQADYQAAVASMSSVQLAALRVTIMAERWLRTNYPKEPAEGPWLPKAYEAALRSVEA